MPIIMSIVVVIDNVIVIIIILSSFGLSPYSNSHARAEGPAHWDLAHVQKGRLARRTKHKKVSGQRRGAIDSAAALPWRDAPR